MKKNTNIKRFRNSNKKKTRRIKRGRTIKKFGGVKNRRPSEYVYDDNGMILPNSRGQSPEISPHLNSNDDDSVGYEFNGVDDNSNIFRGEYEQISPYSQSSNSSLDNLSINSSNSINTHHREYTILYETPSKNLLIDRKISKEINQNYFNDNNIFIFNNSTYRYNKHSDINKIIKSSLEEKQNIDNEMDDNYFLDLYNKLKEIITDFKNRTTNEVFIRNRLMTELYYNNRLAIIKSLWDFISNKNLSNYQKKIIIHSVIKFSLDGYCILTEYCEYDYLLNTKIDIVLNPDWVFKREIIELENVKIMLEIPKQKIKNNKNIRTHLTERRLKKNWERNLENHKKTMKNLEEQFQKIKRKNISNHKPFY